MHAADISYHLQEALDGIPFPAAKIQIITYAGEQGASEEAMEVLRTIPVRQYQNMVEINQELGLIDSQSGDENIW